MLYPSQDNDFLCEHAVLLNNSYRKLLGKDLVTVNHSQAAMAKEMFYAPFVVVSHNNLPDPVFNYANLKALELFGFNWDEFTQLASRLSAEPIHQMEREKLLSKVCCNGYLASYQGIRISKEGSRFLIKNAVVWNLLDDKGVFAGQAAKFEEWEFIT